MIVDRAIHGRGHTLGGNQDDHSDVSITSAVQGDILSYNATAGTWDNGKTITANLATTAITIIQKGAGLIFDANPNDAKGFKVYGDGSCSIGDLAQRSNVLGLSISATASDTPSGTEYASRFTFNLPAGMNASAGAEAANTFETEFNVPIVQANALIGSRGRVTFGADAESDNDIINAYAIDGRVAFASNTNTFNVQNAIGVRTAIIGTLGSVTLDNAYALLCVYPSMGTNKWAAKFTGFIEVECGISIDRPNLHLEQGNVDQDFIIFEGTSAADETKSISTDTAGPYTKKVRVKIADDATQYWLHLFADHT